MTVVSDWKLTFVPPAGGSLVILNYGEDTAEEFSFPWKQQSQGGNPVAGALAINFARGNVTNGLRFTTVMDHATNNAAKLWCLQLQLALNAYSGVTGTLKLEINGEAIWFEMASASINDAEPRVLAMGTARTYTSWEIGGCGWTQKP